MGNWRRDRDSNPGSAQTDNGFRDRRIRPLCHLSAARPRWRPNRGVRRLQAEILETDLRVGWPDVRRSDRQGGGVVPDQLKCDLMLWTLHESLECLMGCCWGQYAGDTLVARLPRSLAVVAPNGQSRHLVKRVVDEAIRPGFPDFTDVVVGREPVQGLEPSGEAACLGDGDEVGLPLIVCRGENVSPLRLKSSGSFVRPDDLFNGGVGLVYTAMHDRLMRARIVIDLNAVALIAETARLDGQRLVALLVEAIHLGDFDNGAGEGFCAGISGLSADARAARSWDRHRSRHRPGVERWPSPGLSDPWRSRALSFIARSTASRRCASVVRASRKDSSEPRCRA